MPNRTERIRLGPHPERSEIGLGDAATDDNDRGFSGETLSLICSGFLVGTGLLARWAGLAPEWIVELIFILAMLAGGWPLLAPAWRSILHLRPDISLLVVVAAGGASIIGQWAEAATVVFLFGVAEWLESWADRRARRAVEVLLEIAPKTAAVKRGDRFVEVPAEEVRANETVAIKSGMRIPLDGKVVAGESGVNQAPITGESAPVDKKKGDMVFAGSVNGDGSLEIQVTNEVGDTKLAQIVRLVQAAQSEKAPIQRFVDRFARYYTPAVTLPAVAVFLVPPLLLHAHWSQWLYRACATPHERGAHCNRQLPGVVPCPFLPLSSTPGGRSGRVTKPRTPG